MYYTDDSILPENMAPLIITAAPYGPEWFPGDADIPLTWDEQVRAAVDCYNAGATMLHVHVRDPDLAWRDRGHPRRLPQPAHRRPCRRRALHILRALRPLRRRYDHRRDRPALLRRLDRRGRRRLRRPYPRDAPPIDVDLLRRECAAPVDGRRLPAEQRMAAEAIDILARWADQRQVGS